MRFIELQKHTKLLLIHMNSMFKNVQKRTVSICVANACASGSSAQDSVNSQRPNRFVPCIAVMVDEVLCSSRIAFKDFRD